MEDTTTEMSELISDRRSRLLKNFDLSSAQGVLPLTNEEFHEQANPIVRSALFAAIKSRPGYDDWTNIFSIGGTVVYKGPQLTIQHEMLFTRILVRARGRSLTKPVHFSMTEALSWLGLKDSGPNRDRAKSLLEDLKQASVKITSKSILKRLYNILTREDLDTVAGDGSFLKSYVKNRFGDYLPMIMKSYTNGEPLEIGLDFITRITNQGHSKRLLVELDVMMSLLFDGVNTTLVPFEVYDEVDAYGKKLLTFIASHRDGVYNMLLENYFDLSGSKSVYSSVERRFKTDFLARLRDYEARFYIEPGWDVVRSREHKWMVVGLRSGPALRIRSELLKRSITDPDPVCPEELEDFYEEDQTDFGPAPEQADLLSAGKQD